MGRPMTDQSLGCAIALSALAPIAERMTHEHARREREEQRQQQLNEALAALPPLERPSAPNEPPRGDFDFDRFFGGTLCSIPICLIWVGNWVSGKTMFDSGFPWIPMLLLSILVGVLLGLWPVVKASPAREKFRARMRDYESAIAAADCRDVERREIRAEFETEQSADEDSL